MRARPDELPHEGERRVVGSDEQRDVGRLAQSHKGGDRIGIVGPQLKDRRARSIDVFRTNIRRGLNGKIVHRKPGDPIRRHRPRRGIEEV